ncbi:DNA-binding transcriptional regulator ume6 [Knufia obscura]|uniref:DNA-binding transcriptional regulator ume6 n=1 Tax=Knufia obscura TaxID=1635080 RepID=A0ABR0RRD2_9EURO|nr:DNA-binding transcriptional regulator ume6 [Knufia obscura]
MAQATEQQTIPAQGKATSPKSSKMHRRSRSGCFTCRLRRKKCSEEKPRCRACRNLGLECEYKRPNWWSNNDTRRKQKDHIKSIIKRTKTNEKTSLQDATKLPPNMRHAMPPPDMYGRGDSEESDDFDDTALDPAFASTPGLYDPHAQQYFCHPDMFGQGYTYEVDVKTERQMYVNDIPTRRDSSISTFSTFVPPPAHSVLPSFTGDDYLQSTQFETPTEDWNGEEGLDFNFFDFSHGPQVPQSTQTAQIEVDDCDQPLLNHLLQNVLPMVFPILEVNQHGSVKSDVILPALETNKAYLHCCLSAAALHMKSLGLNTSENIDGDVLRHKFAFVQEVVGNLGADSNHLQVLEATLGMISLQCITGQADDMERDIPWHQHFQAAVELVRKLDLPQMLEQIPAQGHVAHPPFNMTLTAWIDILGSTMLGRAPVFADTYRNRHLAAGSTGLAELMGCQDNVMYLLSEVSCLDALRLEKRLDDIGVCSHVQSLGQQLDATENPNETIQHPWSSSGAIRPRQLSRNITAIFRKALRLYLCSLVPGFDRYGQASVNLVQQIADMLKFIPSGPDGFDRSLVWPLLIAGSSSTPSSPFRKVLAERIGLLGVSGNTGNFGRMYKLLNEVWRRNDDIILSATVCEATPVTAGALSPNSSPLPPLNTNVGPGSVPQIRSTQEVHWRDVMRENCWDFLLI